MTLSYLIRLLCLCLACFFLIDVLLVFIASAIAPAAIRFAERMKPDSAARFVFGLRSMPFWFAVLFVAGLCVPSYLRLEPRGVEESVGFGCVAAAALAIAIFACSLARALRAIGVSHRYVRECRRLGCEMRLGKDSAKAVVLETATPCLSLAGLFRSRLIISSGVLHTLSTQQLRAALRHERAHHSSRDNLKRLLLILTPGMLPFLSGLQLLERAWARFSEWAADDHATSGDAEQALSLAEALVRLSRLNPMPVSSPLMASLLPDSSDIARRIERLLNKESTREASPRGFWIAAASGSTIVFAAVLALLVRDATLFSVHAALEHLIR